MKSTKVEKMAAVDAQRWAAAEMFYGEGAGNRRKLLDAELQNKYEMPGYYEAFAAAYDALDMNRFAELAIKERKHLDRAAKAGKNLRALKSGNYRGLTNGLFYAGAGYYFFYRTDVGVSVRKQAEAEVKKGWTRIQWEYKSRKEGRRVRKMHEAASREPHGPYGD